jgi:hypothetical protein
MQILRADFTQKELATADYMRLRVFIIIFRNISAYTQKSKSIIAGCR